MKEWGQDHVYIRKHWTMEQLNRLIDAFVRRKEKEFDAAQGKGEKKTLDQFLRETGTTLGKVTRKEGS